MTSTSGDIMGDIMGDINDIRNWRYEKETLVFSVTLRSV